MVQPHSRKVSVVIPTDVIGDVSEQSNKDCEDKHCEDKRGPCGHRL